jgi:hypothetical protein
MPIDSTADTKTPDWVTTTPPDHFYSLDMYANGDVTVQSIELTRAEFIVLKEHLARVRNCAGETRPTHRKRQELRSKNVCR